MYNTTESIDLDIPPRDVAILKARLKYPAASVRELTDVLETEYDIDLSHNRVNDILNEIKEQDFYQETGLLNKSLLNYHLFRIAFHYPSFEERWEDCYTDLMNDPHVVMFFNADDYHHWQFVTQFVDNKHSEEWKHEFFTKHGDLIAQFDKTAMPTVHKLQFDPAVLDDFLAETEEGMQYLENSVRPDSTSATTEAESETD